MEGDAKIKGAKQKVKGAKQKVEPGKQKVTRTTIESKARLDRWWYIHEAHD